MTPPSSPLSEGQQSSNLEAPVPAGQGGLATESRPTLKPCSQAPRRFRISAEHGEAIQNLQESFGISVNGIILVSNVLDIRTLSFNPGDDLYVTENESQLESSTETLLDRFIEDHSEVWQRVYQKKNQKILGTLFCFSVIATSEEDKLMVHTAQWAVNPRHGLSVAEQSFMQQFTSCLNAPRLT